MNEKSVGRTNNWLEEAGYKRTESNSRKTQVTARLEKPVFEILDSRAANNGNSLAEEIRSAVRAGLKKGDSE